MGIRKYLDLYQNFSGSSQEVYTQELFIDLLPDQDQWHEYKTAYPARKSIRLIKPDEMFTDLVMNNSINISSSKNYYHFAIEDTLLMGFKDYDVNFKSRAFEEFMPGYNYTGQKYLIISSSNEIRVYNLFTNNLIANYVKDFTLDSRPVENIDTYYHFTIEKDVFDEGFDDVIIYSKARGTD